jgi:hypothetical protein
MMTADILPVRNWVMQPGYPWSYNKLVFPMTRVNQERSCLLTDKQKSVALYVYKDSPLKDT